MPLFRKISGDAGKAVNSCVNAIAVRNHRAPDKKQEIKKKCALERESMP